MKKVNRKLLFYVIVITLLNFSDTFCNNTQQNNILTQINSAFKLLSSHSDSAKKIVDIAKANSEKINFQLGIGLSYRFYGKYYQYIGDFPISLEYFQNAQNIIKVSGNKQQLGELYRDMGEYFRAVTQLNESIPYLNNALEIFKQLNDSLNLAKTYNRLAASYIQMKSDSLSLVNSYLSLNYIDINKNKSLASNNYNILGRLNTNPDSSEYYYLKSIDLARQDSSNIETVTVLINLSNLKNQTGEFETGLKYASEAYRISYNNGIRSAIQSSSWVLSAIYENLKRYDEAYKYLKLAYNYRDTVANDKKIQEINNLNLKHKLELQETKFKEKTGNYVFIMVLLIALMILGILFILNIYQKKRVLKQKSAELAEKNKLITMQNNDLLHLNATKDKFFSIIAHDLRNPINSFGLATEYLSNELDSMDSKSLHQLIDDLHKNSNHLNELLENLLTWSKTQRKSITFHPIHFNINYLLSSIIGVFSTALSRKSISIINNSQSDFQVYGDNNLINTILRNLIGNAIKFCNEGDTITISTEYKTIDGIEYSSISVEDTGIGMNSEIKNQLFRIESNITSHGTMGEKGTGLGLILCKEFVEMHNGKIWVESELNKGSKFTFIIPTL